MTNFAKTAAAFAFVAATAFGAAQAQETQFDTDQVADFTREVSFDLSTEFAVPTPEMQAQYAEMDETTTIQPDMSYAQNDQEADEEPAYEVAANW